METLLWLVCDVVERLNDDLSKAVHDRQPLGDQSHHHTHNKGKSVDNIFVVSPGNVLDKLLKGSVSHSYRNQYLYSDNGNPAC